MHAKRIRSLLGAAGTCIVHACASSPPPTPEASALTPAPVRAASPTRSSHAGMQVSAELGEIDVAATDATFQSLQPKLLECQTSGIQRVDYLAGDVSFFIRVGADGKTRYAYIVDSTLGDRQTEKCMIQVIRATTWPSPKGGEAEVHKKIGFDVAADTRPPTDWVAEKVKPSIDKQGGDAQRCKGKAPGPFHVTAYILPDVNGKGGKVQSVGVATPTKEGEEAIDCVIEVVKAIPMPSPGSYAAKVSFTL